MIEGFKGIADYVSKRTHRTFTPDAARAAYRRKRDPLPVKSFNGRVGAEEPELDAWIRRQNGRKPTAKAA